MTAVKKLLDKAKDMCDGHSYAALARRLEVTPQTVHQWKNGDVPLSAERIIEIAKIARVPVDDWALLVLSEQAKGEEKRLLQGVVKRLGVATAMLVVLTLGAMPNLAQAATPALHSVSGHLGDVGASAYTLCEIDREWPATTGCAEALLLPGRKDPGDLRPFGNGYRTCDPAQCLRSIRG